MRVDSEPEHEIFEFRVVHYSIGKWYRAWITVASKTNCNQNFFFKRDDTACCALIRNLFLFENKVLQCTSFPIQEFQLFVKKEYNLACFNSWCIRGFSIKKWKKNVHLALAHVLFLRSNWVINYPHTLVIKHLCTDQTSFIKRSAINSANGLFLVRRLDCNMKREAQYICGDLKLFWDTPQIPKLH